MRTRILPKMLNSEAEEYLSRNDIIIVPVGTTEQLMQSIKSESFSSKSA